MIKFDCVYCKVYLAYMKRAKAVLTKQRITRSTRLSPEVIQGLDAISRDKNGLTQSRHIEIAIREYLIKKGAIKK